MLDEIEYKTVHKDREGNLQRKKNNTLSEVKPVEKISKNMQSFTKGYVLCKKSPSFTLIARS